MNGARAADLAVIGGGLQGCAVGLFAARAGLRVTVIEKDTFGRHASGVNAGGLRRLFRDPAEIPLSARAAEMWRGIAALVGDDCGFRSVPHVKVAETEDELAELAARAERLRAAGWHHEVTLDRAALREVLPAVAEHCVGALAVLDDCCALPYATCRAFRRAAEAAGAEVLEGCAARALRRDRGLWHLETDAGVVRAGRILNAAGAWGGRLAAMIGDDLPIEPIAPLMLVTDRMPRFCEAVVGAARRPLSFKQMGDGIVVIGGARLGRADPASNRTDLDFAQLRRTAAAAAAIFPVMRRARVVRAWSGIAGRTPDRLPVIGRSPRDETAFHACGFSAHGFQLAPAVGEAVAELVVAGTLPHTLAPFGADRFHP